MKQILFGMFIIMVFLEGCATIEEMPVLIGPGHTFRDLRQHTFSESETIKYFHPAISRYGNLMAFVKEEAGKKNIFIKPVNSKAMTQKTFNKTDNAYPSFSPDSKYLAYASKRNGNWDIFVINTYKGRAKRQITSSPEDEICPTWSKDGTKIAFCRFSRSSGQWEIWFYNLKNGSLTNLITGKFPQFSPTENLIVFQRAIKKNGSDVNKWYAIWTIDDMGYEETLIVSSEEEGYINPYWSLDGERIVFASGGKWDKVSAVKHSF
jgi:Tol biopolymer transport system component